MVLSAKQKAQEIKKQSSLAQTLAVQSLGMIKADEAGAGPPEVSSRTGQHKQPWPPVRSFCVLEWPSSAVTGLRLRPRKPRSQPIASTLETAAPCPRSPGQGGTRAQPPKAWPGAVHGHVLNQAPNSCTCSLGAPRTAGPAEHIQGQRVEGWGSGWLRLRPASTRETKGYLELRRTDTEVERSLRGKRS